MSATLPGWWGIKNEGRSGTQSSDCVTEACFAALSISSRLSRIQSHASLGVTRSPRSWSFSPLLSFPPFSASPSSPYLDARQTCGRNAYTHTWRRQKVASIESTRPAFCLVSSSSSYFDSGGRAFENWLIRYPKWSRRRSAKAYRSPLRRSPPSQNPWFSTMAGI